MDNTNNQLPDYITNDINTRFDKAVEACGFDVTNKEELRKELIDKISKGGYIPNIDIGINPDILKITKFKAKGKLR